MYSFVSSSRFLHWVSRNLHRWKMSLVEPGNYVRLHKITRLMGLTTWPHPLFVPSRHQFQKQELISIIYAIVNLVSKWKFRFLLISLVLISCNWVRVPISFLVQVILHRWIGSRIPFQTRFWWVARCRAFEIESLLWTRGYALSTVDRRGWLLGSVRQRYGHRESYYGEGSYSHLNT